MKRNRIAAILICLLALLSGCTSYKDMEDSIRQKLSGDSSNGNSLVDTDYENLAEITEDNVAGIGDTLDVDTALYYKADRGTIQYTLEDVEFLTSLEGTGLKPDDFKNPSKFQEDGSLADAEDYSIVMITVRLKNVDIDIEDAQNLAEEGERTPFFIDYGVVCESDLKDPDGPFTLALDYFSEHPDSEKSYYRYSLQKGEEMEAVLAWVVPGEQLEEPFYYVVGIPKEVAYWQYFLLNPEVGNE